MMRFASISFTLTVSQAAGGGPSSRHQERGDPPDHDESVGQERPAGPQAETRGQLMSCSYCSAPLSIRIIVLMKIYFSSRINPNNHCSEQRSFLR